MDFIVGTFRTSRLCRIRFDPPQNLQLVRVDEAVGGHSWLSLSRDKKYLYTTVWSEKPQVAAYHFDDAGAPQLINTAKVKAMTGYVACSPTYLFSVGGPTGEVFKLRDDGGIGKLVQELSFVDSENEKKLAEQDKDSHGAFGGLRYGAHSVDLSPDGQSLYIADIGRNCIWTYAIDPQAASSSSAPLTLGEKHISPRSNDGPRHTWPHPNGKILYSLQEHSSMVDMFAVAPDGTTLEHIEGHKIIPLDKNPEDYWADEVRLSTDRSKGYPRYLYASTRGLKPETKGYVCAFSIDKDGWIDGSSVSIYETATSGGLANAIEPAPAQKSAKGVEYLAMTDSEQGLVFVLQYDGHKFSEAARLKLDLEGVGVVQPATAVWL